MALYHIWILSVDDVFSVYFYKLLFWKNLRLIECDLYEMNPATYWSSLQVTLINYFWLVERSATQLTDLQYAYHWANKLPLNQISDRETHTIAHFLI